MSSADSSEREIAIAAVRREFRDGLPHRVAALEQALAAVAAGRPDALQDLLMRSHALKGTAAAFGAAEIAARAASLEQRARDWGRERGGASAAELAAAREDLVRLADAVVAYQSAAPLGPA